MLPELLKKYIGKELILRIRGAQFTNAFLSDVTESMVVIVTQNHVSKSAMIHFIDIANVTAFSVVEPVLDEEHAGYIEKYNIRQTFK